MFQHIKVTPRNGRTLVVLIVARISGCQSQKEASLDDQVQSCQHLARQLYDGEIDFRIVSTKGKGEDIERPELEEIAKSCRSGNIDILVQEDVGRLVRGTDAVKIWGTAVDHGIRCIAPLDGVDTEQKEWETNLIQACARHVQHNELTSLRIKCKGMTRFERCGAMTALPIAGYHIPENAKTYYEWERIDRWTPTIAQGLAKLAECGNCSTIADDFNAAGFPVGPYCRNPRWDGKMVRRFYKNRILGGKPGRGFKESVKNHKSGRRISRPKNGEPVFIDCPNLAHVDIDELDRVNAILDDANSNAGRKSFNGRVQRKDSVFPAQFATCYYCGHHYVRGGNGLADNLMCCNSRNWKCWHSISFNGALATERIVNVLIDTLDHIDGFADQFAQLVAHVNSQDDQNIHDRLYEIRSKQTALDKQHKNLIQMVEAVGADEELKERIKQLRAEKAQLEIRRIDVERSRRNGVQLPSSIDELRRDLKQKMSELATTSVEFREWMVKLVPAIHVYAVRLIDGGHLLPRALVRLDLTGSISDSIQIPELTQLLSREVTVDFFNPPQRETIREDAVRLIANGMFQRDAARQLGVTQPAVQRALELNDMMLQRGLTSPYEIIFEPPADYAKLRRHCNPRYNFESKLGYELPQLG